MAGVNSKPDRAWAGWKSADRAYARLAWEARRAWGRVGPAVFSGLACVALALPLLWQTQELRQRQSEIAQKFEQRHASAANPAFEDKQDRVEHRLTAFYEHLPGHEVLPDLLRRLIDLAEKNDVTLFQAEYKPQVESDANFLRYQMVFPLKAEYPRVQAFLLASMQEVPTLILESVSFKRDRIESSEVEARVQYVLLVKKPAVQVMPQ